MTELHAALEPIAGLLGTWRGEGAGRYPTIASFGYREEATFWHSGKPWLGYLQKTWHVDSGAPLHSEAGYWRPQADGRIEVILSHANGVIEIEEGTIGENRLEMATTSIAASTTAKDVAGLARVIEWTGDTLTYSLEMAFEKQPLQNHLSATLRRA